MTRGAFLIQAQTIGKEPNRTGAKCAIDANPGKGLHA